MRVPISIALLTLGILALSSWTALAQLAPPDAGAPPADSAAQDSSGYEVLTRGPVHEAFAEAAVATPQAGVVIPRQPPQPIEEQPPETRPEGENVVWLPGYWHWDDERQDFLWISGVWRAVPPDREWTPGYWTQAEGGYQWVAGYWASRGAASAEVQYLPPPPDSLEAGPTSPAPSDDYTWTPGCWMWRSARYVWQPGYWIVLRPNWIWIPNYYVWTPYGCVLAGGYSDYPVQSRGLLFAPIYFSSPVYTQPAFAYRPSYCIGYDVLTTYLFARPRYCHYYFGDYFAPRYAGSGYRPWFQSAWGRGNYDPLFSYYRQVNGRNVRDWDRRLVDRYAYLRDNESARPPRTLAAQLAGEGGGGRDGRPDAVKRDGAIQIAQSVDRFRQSARNRYGVQLGQASTAQLEQAARQRRSWQDLQTSRRRAETADGSAASRGPSVDRDPHRARWNAENPIARDAPNVAGPEGPRTPRPDVGQGIAQPGRSGRPGNARTPGDIGATRAGVGARNQVQSDRGRDRGNIGRDRDNPLGDRRGATEGGSSQAFRPIPRPDVDTRPGVEADRPSLNRSSRDRPGRVGQPYEGSPQRRSPQAAPDAGNVAPSQRPSGPSVERPLPDRSSGGNRGYTDRAGRGLPPMRDNALRTPRPNSPVAPQVTSPQMREPRSYGPGPAAGQRPAGPSQSNVPQFNRPNFNGQTMQRPISPPLATNPAANRPSPSPSPRMQAPINNPGGGGAQPNPGQFRRPTAGGGGSLGAPQAQPPRPEINHAASSPGGGGQHSAGTRGHGRGKDGKDN